MPLLLAKSVAWKSVSPLSSDARIYKTENRGEEESGFKSFLFILCEEVGRGTQHWRAQFQSLLALPAHSHFNCNMEF